jgi:uncharacterized protein YbjQ (UPF0145 family)
MAHCAKCSGKLNFFDSKQRIDGAIYCYACASQINDEKNKSLDNTKGKKVNSDLRQKNTDEIARIFVVSVDNPSGVKIAEHMGIICSRAVYAISLLKNVSFAFERNEQGGRSVFFEKRFAEIENQALRELKEKAFNRGADGVVGVRIEHQFIESTGMISIGGKLLLLSMSGTAVKTVKNALP